ncbi:MAG: sigma-70 family RNA polymerase sigma factor [Pirellulaceae bacterium]
MRKRFVPGEDRVDNATTSAEIVSPVAVSGALSTTQQVDSTAPQENSTGQQVAAAQPVSRGDAPLNTANVLQVRQLADTYYADVYRYAYRLSGAAAESEDLTQQTFLMALQRVHQLREPSRAKAWLFAVLRSCFLKGCRKRVPLPAASLELDIGMIPENVSELEVDSEQLQKALNELSDEFRLVLVMFYFEQLSYKEIASALKIAKGTVMSRLARAKRQLRYKLISTGGTSGQIQERLDVGSKVSADTNTG